MESLPTNNIPLKCAVLPTSGVPARSGARAQAPLRFHMAPEQSGRCYYSVTLWLGDLMGTASMAMSVCQAGFKEDTSEVRCSSSSMILSQERSNASRQTVGLRTLLMVQGRVQLSIRSFAQGPLCQTAELLQAVIKPRC